MRVTVVICTRDRGEMLRQTLEQMTRLQIPGDTVWELLVIDNGTTTATEKVVAGFTSRLPLRWVPEPRGGLSHARNRAVREATGEYIVWTDDDVLVDQGWLAAYREAFALWPEASIFGGPIAPWFEGAPPAWLRRTLPRIGGAFALLDLGPDTGPLAAEGLRIPFGANYAVRSVEQRQHLYEMSLGRQPGNTEIVGEEVDVLTRMLDSGATGWWVPHARVQHRVGAQRQTIRYLRRQLRGYGEYVGWRAVRDGERRKLGGTAAIVARALRAEVRYRVRRITSSPERWIEDLIVASESWGLLRGLSDRR